MRKQISEFAVYEVFPLMRQANIKKVCLKYSNKCVIFTFRSAPLLVIDSAVLVKSTGNTSSQPKNLVLNI